MKKYFLVDSTALVYAYSPGCQDLADLVEYSCHAESDTRIVVCDIAFPEVIVALVESKKAQEIDVNHLRWVTERLKRDFHPNSSPFIIIEVSGVVSETFDWFQAHDISTPAAITLAASVAARAALPPNTEICLVTRDHGLTNAAKTENLEVCSPHEVKRHM